MTKKKKRKSSKVLKVDENQKKAVLLFVDYFKELCTSCNFFSKLLHINTSK